MAQRAPARQRKSAGAPEEGLRCRVRLADGRTFCGELPPWRHRALQLGMLHAESEGLVELTPGTRPLAGKVKIDRRARRDGSPALEHFLPGGAAGSARWLEQLLVHAQRIIDGNYAYKRFKDGPREEAFVGVTPRTAPRGSKDAVAHTRFLWLDVDKPDRLPALWDFLAERPCQLLCESAGSGGVHCYWKLSKPLPAERVVEQTGAVVDLIERANLRLIHALGSDPDGKPSVADRQCANRDRVMRLAGSVNWKTGGWARIVEADFALEPYRLAALVGDLPDPDVREYTRTPLVDRDDEDPYRRIPASEYMVQIAGLEPDRAGFVHCPNPAHPDRNPSCSVRGKRPELWKCHACGAAGSIYDLASLVLGGPWGRGRLSDDAFRRARAYVLDVFGELT